MKGKKSGKKARRIISVLLALLICISALVFTAGASGVYYSCRIANVTARKLADFLGSENAQLTGNTVKIINDFNLKTVCGEAEGDEDFGELSIIGLEEDITVDLNGHTISDAMIYVGNYENATGTLTFKDSAGGAKMIGMGYSCPLMVYDTPLVIDGGTYIGYDKPDFAGYAASALELGGNINVNILSGSFYGGQFGSGICIYVENDNCIEKLSIGNGVVICGGDQNEQDSPFRPGHGIEICSSLSGPFTLAENTIEIGAAVISGGNIFEGGDAIYSDSVVKLKISKAAKLTGGEPGGKDINVPEGSLIEWVDATASDRFTDIAQGKWYKEYVDYVATYGLMNGMSENTFEPNTELSRSMFVQILANMNGVDTTDRAVETQFADVPSGKWYTPAVKWAADEGIVNGISPTEFGPTESIQRQQICVMLVRYAEQFGITLSAENEKKQFSDDDKIQNYAKEAVYICQQAGIVSGMIEDTFAPRNNATRAQIATFVTRFHRIAAAE